MKIDATVRRSLIATLVAQHEGEIPRRKMPLVKAAEAAGFGRDAARAIASDVIEKCSERVKHEAERRKAKQAKLNEYNQRLHDAAIKLVGEQKEDMHRTPVREVREVLRAAGLRTGNTSVKEFCNLLLEYQGIRKFHRLYRRAEHGRFRCNVGEQACVEQVRERVYPYGGSMNHWGVDALHTNLVLRADYWRRVSVAPTLSELPTFVLDIEQLSKRKNEQIYQAKWIQQSRGNNVEQVDGLIVVKTNNGTVSTELVDRKRAYEMSERDSTSLRLLEACKERFANDDELQEKVSVVLMRRAQKLVVRKVIKSISIRRGVIRDCV